MLIKIRQGTVRIIKISEESRKSRQLSYFRAITGFIIY